MVIRVSISLSSRSSPATACDMRIMVARVEVLERGFNGREVRLRDLWRDLGMA